MRSVARRSAAAVRANSRVAPRRRPLPLPPPPPLLLLLRRRRERWHRRRRASPRSPRRRSRCARCSLVPCPCSTRAATGGGGGAPLGIGGPAPSLKSGCLTVVQEDGGKRELLRWIELDTVLWEVRLTGERITLVTGNRSFAAAATARGYLHLFSATGRRLFPPAGASCAVSVSARMLAALTVGSDSPLPPAHARHALPCP